MVPHQMIDKLRMVAVFREDLPMPPGKLAAQAGHAFMGAAQQAPVSLLVDYMAHSQPKVTLIAPDLAALETIYAKAKSRGVSAVLIMDEGRTVFPEPTVTVLGLGPMTKTDSNALTRGLKLL